MSDGSVIIDIKVNDGEVKQVNAELNGLEKSGGKASLGIGKIAAALGLVKIAGAAIDLVKQSIDKAFNRIDTMEQFNRTITAITGSADASSVALERLKAITKGTAYGLDVAAKATQNFVTRGLEINKATRQVEAWGDAVAFYGKGSNEELETVTDALSKMRTKGTVEMEQMNRLFDVGINAVGMYAQATGRSAADVQADLSAGTISAADFIDTVTSAMMEGTNGVQKIAGAAKEAGASWRGTWDNMRAAVTRGMVNIITAIDSGLQAINMPTMREGLMMIGRGFESVMTDISKYIPIILKGVQSVYKTLQPWLPLIKNIAIGIGGFVIAVTVFNKVNGAVEATIKVFKGFSGAANNAVVVFKAIASGADASKAGLTTLSKGIVMVGQSAGNLGKTLLTSLGPAAPWVIGIGLAIAVIAALAFALKALGPALEDYGKRSTSAGRAQIAMRERTAAMTAEIAKQETALSNIKKNGLEKFEDGYKKLYQYLERNRLNLGIEDIGQTIESTQSFFTDMTGTIKEQYDSMYNTMFSYYERLGTLDNESTQTLLANILTQKDTAISETESHQQAVMDILQKAKDEKRDRLYPEEQQELQTHLAAMRDLQLNQLSENQSKQLYLESQLKAGMLEINQDSIKELLEVQQAGIDDSLEQFYQRSGDEQAALNELHDKKLISEEEFEKQWAEMLSRQSTEELDIRKSGYNNLAEALSGHKLDTIATYQALNSEIESEQATNMKTMTQAQLDRLIAERDALGVSKEQWAEWQSFQSQLPGEQAQVLQGLIDETNAGMDGTIQAIINSKEPIKGAADANANAQVSAVSEAGPKMEAETSKNMDKVRKAIQDKAPTIEETAKQISDKATSAIKAKRGEWEGAGSHIADGVAVGIDGAAGRIARSAASMVRTALNSAKAEADIHSPSRKSRDEIGKMFGEGVALGIFDKVATVAKASKQLVSAAFTGAQGFSSDLATLSPKLAGYSAELSLSTLSMPGPSISSGVGSTAPSMAKIEELLAIIASKDPNLYIEGRQVSEATDPYSAAQSKRRERQISRGLAQNVKV